MAFTQPANLGAITDRRISVEADAIGSKELDSHHAPVNEFEPATRLFDPNVSFEEYHYYANLERAYEKSVDQNRAKGVGLFDVLIGKVVKKKDRDEAVRRASLAPDTSPSNSTSAPVADMKAADFKEPEAAPETPTQFHNVITDAEWHNAARAARTATWGAVFYLITTDILGPFSVPWAFGQLGYGPGVALYVVFAVTAAYSGYLLYWQFLGLDSTKYPITGYGDIAFRIFGRWARHVVNILQSFQFFLNVTLLIISQAQGLSQIAVGPYGNGFLCFVVSQVIFMVLGGLLGQIRSLQTFAYIANICVWLNLFVIFMTMGIVAQSGPNWDAAIASGYVDQIGPIQTYAGSPPGGAITDQINGLMQAVYSYGGATLYVNLMAEMRRPFDFWKGLILADVVIFLCYIIFGIVVYSYQGQATFNPAYQGINPYAWQTVGNVFALITGLIAAVLYGNIGIKVLYANVGREFLRFPALETKWGRIIWIIFVPAYWICAFIIAAAVPQVSYLGSFVGAAFILQFSYTFPPLLSVGYNCLKDSLPADGGWDPATGRVTTVDSGIKRWIRGYRVKLFRNVWDTIYFLGALVTAILGIYASIVGMIQFYADTAVTAFTCINPAG